MASEPVLDFFVLDGAKATDILEFLHVPHYTNSETWPDKESEKTVLHYMVVPYDEDVPMIVKWANRGEPTEQEVLELIGEAQADADEAGGP